MAETVLMGGSPTSHEDKLYDRKLLISNRSKNGNSVQLTCLFASYIQGELFGEEL
jgi:hypothetical protein